MADETRLGEGRFGKEIKTLSGHNGAIYGLAFRPDGKLLASGAKDGTVTAFIEDMESTTPDHSGAEGVGVDAKGNVYGAVVRRQMLERHVRK